MKLKAPSKAPKSEKKRVSCAVIQMTALSLGAVLIGVAQILRAIRPCEGESSNLPSGLNLQSFLSVQRHDLNDWSSVSEKNTEKNAAVDFTDKHENCSHAIVPKEVLYMGNRHLYSVSGKPGKEAYSGMWWLSTKQFLESDFFYLREYLESASFRVFQDDRVHVTRDWLDFNLEHMSIFWKHFAGEDSHPLEVIQQRLDDYIHNRSSVCIPEGTAPPRTIAVLPLTVKRSKLRAHIIETQKYGLTATLISLYRMGIGRMIIVGNTEDSTKMAKGSINEVLEYVRQDKRYPHVQISYVWAGYSRAYLREYLTKKYPHEKPKLMMPEIALVGLQRAMRGEMKSHGAREWLGHDNIPGLYNKTGISSASSSGGWDFVYFTEPDLIVHVRPSALPSMTDLMAKSGKTLSAHRFQPIPHRRDFPEYASPERLLTHDISHRSKDSLIHMNPRKNSKEACCDGGLYYPSNIENPKAPLKLLHCGYSVFWWQCGLGQTKPKPTNVSSNSESDGDDFDSNDTRANETSSSMTSSDPQPVLRYRLFQIDDGTGFPLVHIHQHMCNYKADGHCEAD